MEENAYPIFKIGDKVVDKRNGKIQLIQSIQYRTSCVPGKQGRFLYNDNYWSDELRYANFEEVGKYFQ